MAVTSSRQARNTAQARVAQPARPRREALPRPRPRAVPQPTPRRLKRRSGFPQLLDRLLRSRAWIWMLGLGLCGIVAMQVSLLKLNAGISHAVERAGTLERENATLEGKVARLSSSERIQAAAQARGMILPQAGAVGFLKVRPKIDSARAVANLRRSRPHQPAVVPTTTTPPLQALAPTGTPGAASAPPIVPAQPQVAAPQVAPVAPTPVAPTAPAATQTQPPVTQAAPAKSPGVTAGGAAPTAVKQSTGGAAPASSQTAGKGGGGAAANGTKQARSTGGASAGSAVGGQRKK